LELSLKILSDSKRERRGVTLLAKEYIDGVGAGLDEAYAPLQRDMVTRRD